MLNFSLLQPLVHAKLESFFVCGHLVCLLLHELCFRGQNLLVPRIVVLLPFLLFELLHSTLHLMGFLVVLLFGQIALDPLQVKQLC